MTTADAPAPATPVGSSAAVAPAVVCRGLEKRYGRHVALRGVDLEVPRGCVFGYLGPNGAGKTTTIRILVGLMRPSGGTVEVLGHDVAAARDEAQRLVGYLPGDFVAYPELTGHEFLAHLAALRGGVDPSVVADLQTRLEAELDRPVKTLSHGNRQKIGIIQAFMHRPEVVVLDEPTSGLDPLVQRAFLTLLRDTSAEGRTVFLSSHVLSEVEAVADVVAILRAGEVVVTDTVDRLEEQAVQRLDLGFARLPDLDALRRTSGVQSVDVVEHTVRVTVRGSTAALLREVAPYGVETISTREADLEDVFLELYGRGGTP